MARITIRPLVAADLDAADRIMRVAFGTFIGLDPAEGFLGDGDYVRSRFAALPAAAFAATVDDRVVGSNFAARWGSFASVGPLTVSPDCWNHGIASRLMEPICALLDDWGVAHAGLFTFAHSPRHLGLYQKFGFRPRALTLLLARAVTGCSASVEWSSLAALDMRSRAAALDQCGALAGRIFAGLDARAEIESIAAQGLGDTVLVREGGRVTGFAACHAGAGSEGGSATCYLKFAAVAPDAGASRRLAQLLDGCSAFARSRGAGMLRAGVNAARTRIYEAMLGHGFRIERTGIAMHRPNRAGFNRANAWVLDDWR